MEVIVCFLHDLQLYDLIRTVRNKTKIVFLNYYPITVIEVYNNELFSLEVIPPPLVFNH